MSLFDILHPEYAASAFDWRKWRLAYCGGRDFIEAYLQKFTTRETDDNFRLRKQISYNPAFAKSAVNEIINSIHTRLVDVVREGGDDTYQQSITGKLGGVDRRGSSMNNFLGKYVLPELLVMQKVGVFIDMPKNVGRTKAETKGVHPYLYTYRRENILSWQFNDDNVLTSVLLSDNIIKYENGLPSDTQEVRKYLKLVSDGVLYQVKAKNDDIIESGTLELTKLPFIMPELSNSLLCDIADYQIGLLNLASSDMAYGLNANFPFYTEQFDAKTASPHLKKDTDEQTVKVGAVQGRRYPTGVERPSFINPSAEPLRASMEKQSQMKEELRLLLHLTIANLQASKQVSAESKSLDNTGLEAGLANIGLELQYFENQAAEIWAEYLGNKTPATVKYPERWSLRNQDDINKEVESKTKTLESIPSLTYKKILSKQIVELTIGNRTPQAIIDKINQEIEKAPAIVSNHDNLDADLEKGLVDAETASQIRCYPKGVVKTAQEEMAKRLELIQKSQTDPARGVKDTQPNPTLQDKIDKQ